MEQMRRAYTVLLRKPEDTTVKTSVWMVEYIKMKQDGIGCEDADWIQTAQNRLL
jgi:hypothetical protein